MYHNSSPEVIYTAFTTSSTLLIVFTVMSLRKFGTKISTKDFSLGDHSFANVGPLYIKPCKIAWRSMPSHPHICPSKRSPPLTWGRCAKQCWDILRGRFVVVIDLEAHVLNKDYVHCPILGMEDKVCDFFSLLAVDNSPQS